MNNISTQEMKRRIAAGEVVRIYRRRRRNFPVWGADTAAAAARKSSPCTCVAVGRVGGAWTTTLCAATRDTAAEAVAASSVVADRWRYYDADGVCARDTADEHPMPEPGETEEIEAEVREYEAMCGGKP